MLNSDLHAKWRMRTSVMRLAGGPEAQADLFASRLRTFLRETGAPFIVSTPTRMILAWDEAARQMLILAPQLGPLFDEPELAYELCGYDLARGLGPNPAPEPVTPSDPLVRRFGAVRQLISDWPEFL